MAGRIAFIPLRSNSPLSDIRPVNGELVIEPTTPHKAYWKRHDTGAMEELLSSESIINALTADGSSLVLNAGTF